MRRSLNVAAAVVLLLGVPASTAVLAAADWTRFRGPNGQGNDSAKCVPTRWSESENIAWKVSIAGRGWSSPVILGRSIWLTTAVRDGRSLRAICVDADSGRIRHDVEVFRPDAPVAINPKNSYASPSPVVEPDRVYVHFGAMGTACLATDSAAELWRNQNLVIDHKEGPGSSPILFEDLLIVNCDGQDQQYVVGLDKRTGRIVWKTNRSAPLRDKPDFRKAYSTPALVNVAGKPQLISTGADQVNAYDPKTGKELWRVRYSGFSNVPVPLIDGNRVFVVTDFSRPELWALRTDGQGDVTDSAVIWKLTRQVGASPTPVLLENRLYLVSDQGVVTCVNAESGKPAWQRRIGGTFSASVLALGGNIYLPSEQGKTTVLDPLGGGRSIAVNALEGRIFATPAVDDCALILRTDSHLYRIESRPPSTAGALALPRAVPADAK